MKKLAGLLAAAGVLVGGALYLRPTAERLAPGPATVALTKEETRARPAPSTEHTPPTRADLSLAEAEIPYDPELPDVNGLREDEIESEIHRLDERLAREQWAERANRGELKAAELLKLRGLLHHRNRLFERKLDLAGL